MGFISTKFLCSILPAILLILYVRYRDRKSPEPWGKIIKGVSYGVLTTFLVLMVDQVWCVLPNIFGFGWIESIPVVRSIFKAFYEAAIPEESAKLLMLWLLLRNCREFNDNMDGIVYAVCVGMGFAGLENILYIYEDQESWQMTAIMRSLLAVPGHYIFAVIMGFFYSIVHFQPQRFGKYNLLIWLLPVLAHGIYDSICFIGNENEIVGLLIYIPLIWFCVKMHKFCLGRINSMELIDEDRKDLDTFTHAMKK